MADSVGFKPLAVTQDGASMKIIVDGGTPEYISLVNIQAVYGNTIDFRSIGVAVLTTGAGLDDLTTSGVNMGDNSEIVTYEVEIATADTPDDFKWRKKVGNQPFTAFSADIAMTGVPQELEDGIFIDFAATTGHTLADAWQFTVKESTSMTQLELYPHEQLFRVTVQQLNGQEFHFDLEDESAQAGWTSDAAGLAQALADINTWIGAA